jgi:iron complex outermembrane receptor protein
MKYAARSFRQKLLLCTASALVCAVVPAVADPAAVNLAPGVGGVQYAQSANAVSTSTSSSSSQSITVKAAARLLKQKDSPSAVTELGAQQIQATGVSGSPASLLRQAPSVYVYQQGIGDNAPEFTVRGLRGLEIATTLDGIPTQDLEAPGSFYLANNLGGVFTLGQIQGVHLYPGVAYPDQNTFGTIGGTIAYDSKRPTNDFYFDVTGEAGSFQTWKEGFELNSGALNGPFGTGDNAPKILLNYYNLQSGGFVDGTAVRENEMEFAFDKPYDDGLSKFQATVIYNTAGGYIENEPVPTPYLQKNGFFSNYPTSLDSATQSNNFLTVILKDTQYINDYLTAGLSAFYLANNNQLNDYSSVLLDVPGGFQGPLSVGNSSPFINNPGGFGEGPYFGPPVGGGGFGIFGGGTGGLFYGIPGNTYNPYALYPAGSKECPQSFLNKYYGGSIYGSPCGINDQITGGHSDTYGIQPKLIITPPDIFGIANTIKVGALVAKESSPAGYEYLGGDPNTPQDAANQVGVRTGGTQRTIYQGYAQDKIDFLDNTLHLTPGATLEGTFSSFKGSYVFGSAAAPGIVGPNDIDLYGPYKAVKWDREFLPFFNVSYDFDKILPPLKGLNAYASTGESALFAPVGDFSPSAATTPPYASIVHFYEAGLVYNTSKLVLGVDYFYQKIDRDFGFFEFQSGPQNGDTEYSNFGQRETKGVEGKAIYQLTPQFQLFGNFSHTLAKYLTSGDAFDTVAEDQYGVAFKGAPETGIPDWIANFGVDYEKKSTFVDADDVNVRFAGTYTGHQNTTYDLGGNDYLNPSYNFPGLLPLNFAGCPGNPNPNGSCEAYTRYNQITGATVYDKNGGISPFAIFNLDVNYKLPTPTLPVLKSITFDANIQNLFDQRYFQYFYKQISPSSCGTFTSGEFVGLPKNNYSCTPSFADDIPGQPFSVFITVTARF